MLEIDGRIEVDVSIQDTILCQDNIRPTIVKHSVHPQQSNQISIPFLEDVNFINDEPEYVKASTEKSFS